MALGTNAIFQGEWALMRTKLLVGALLVAATAIWAGLNIAAFAASPSGAAVAVVPSAAAEGIAGLRTLVVKGPVYSGDRVKTGPAGLAQILFNDKTRLVVGRNASLLIDKFVYDPNSSAQKFTISATRGAFRFITGKAAKDAYTIRTPTATLGVRGTEFDFSIGPGGETRLALLEGSVRLCNRSGRCITVSGACSVVVVAPNGRIERPASAARSSLLKAAFPFVGGQAGLRADFRVNVSACGLRAPSAPKTRKASLTPGEPTKIAAPQKIRSAGGKSGGGNSGGVAGGGGASGGGGTKGGTGGGGSGGSSSGGSVVAGGSGGGGSSGGGSGPVVGAGGGGGPCGGNCGVGKGGGGGNDTGNEGGGAGPGNSGGNGGGKGGGNGGNGGGNSGGNGGGKGGR